MKRTDKFVKREIFGDIFLVPIGESSQNVNGLIAINDVCSFIYDNFDRDITIDELVEKITEHYDIDKETAKSDAEECIKGFSELGIVE